MPPEIMDAVFPLIGVVIGGLITYLTTSAVEERKWKRERLAKRQEQEREALREALKWLDPIDNALMKATLVTSQTFHYPADRTAALKKYPDLLTTLASLDLPPHLQVMLPKDAYDKGVGIIRGLDDLKMTLRQSPESFQVPGRSVYELQTKANTLRRQLTDAYRKTFD